MTEMAELKAVGAVAVTDDGKDIQSSWVMRRVLEYARMCGLVYLAHCEDHSLMSDGAMNEGYNATRLGIPGLAVVELDSLAQLEAPGVWVHLLPPHCSGGGHDPLVVSRLPGQGVRKVVPVNRGNDTAAGPMERASPVSMGPSQI